MISCAQTVAAFIVFAAVVAPGAHAQQTAATGTTTTDPTATVATDEKAVPYDERLVRLAEIIGSVHYLRNLCGKTSEDAWRTSMQQLLDTETKNEVGRRERFTAGFNRGFRTFASVYTTCTGSAVTAEERYRAEGATLVAEIVARFGN